ncbi:MAG: T9SS type A sorting domain-containing protein [Candidatus Kapabacteria bacterium]|nr:T9SS type A sorting domain-containing protein [Ignavibacteriota bacterium]MCW5885577.1 T9SS type A sorting domain-containing protein [Candidatus Kapabacteria bacterium]
MLRVENIDEVNIHQLQDYTYYKSDNGSYDFIIHYDELQNFSQMFINYDILTENLEAELNRKLRKSNISEIKLSNEYFRLGSVSGYFTYYEIYSEFDRMMELFPDFVSKNLEGYSIEGRPIFSYCFGNNACFSDNIFPQVLITSLIHAREPGSVFTLIYYFWDLLARFENGEELARNLLSNRHIYVIPNLNPDGVVFNETNYPQGGGLWRKNRRVTSDSTFGVDINRNFGPLQAWDAPNNGSSLLMRSDTYRGTEPFSEPETRIMRDFLKNKNFRIGVNYHSFANAVFYPYSYLSRENPDSNFYRYFLTDNYYNNRYLFGLDLDVINYPTRGSSDDFLYMGNDDFEGFLAMTCEVGNPIEGFWSPIEISLENAKQNIKYLDNLIISAGQNISVFDKDVYIKNNKYYIRLTLANIGYENLPEFDVKIFQPENLIYFASDMKRLPALIRGDTASVEFEYHPLSVANGSIIDFQITAYLDFEKKEQFKLQIFDYDETDLFDESIKYSFDKDWHYSIDGSNTKVLKSNFGDTYKQNIESKAEFDLQDAASDKSLYTLRFRHKFGIEANYDFGLIFAENHFGANVNPHFGENLVKGRTRPGSRQSDLLFGFHGSFKEWLPQTLYLNDTADIFNKISFNLWTDKGVNKSGWIIGDLKLRKFSPDKTSIIEPSKNEYFRIYPNPILNGEFVLVSDISITNAELQVVSINGKVVFAENFELVKGENRIISNNISNGKYFIVIKCPNKNYLIPFTVIN